MKGGDGAGTRTEESGPLAAAHPRFDADVIVIGSGFGGAVSALRLSEKGYSVVVLEKGRRWAPEDFPETNRSLRRYLWAPRLGLRGIQVLSPFRHALVLHGCGVGGGSLVYANTLVEPEPEVFDGWDQGGADWRSRLAPHYATARRMLGATPCAGVGRTDEILRDVGREMTGRDTFRVHDVGVWFGTPGRTVPDPYFGGEGPDRTGCTRCGACMVGCRVGAKNTLDRNYLWLAERRGARIVPETEARILRPLPGGGVEVETRRSLGLRRGRRTWRARQVVVGAGVVGTVDLLLRSRDSGGLSGLSSWVGRRVRTNSESLLAADAPPGGESWSDHVAITSGVQLDAETHLEMVRFNDGSDALAWLTVPLTDGGGRVPRPLRLLAAMVRHPIRALRGLWPLGRARRTGIVLAMQTSEGELELVRSRPWWAPWRRRLRSRLPVGEPRPVPWIPAANEATRRLARRMGGHAWSTWPEVLLGAPITAHLLGGCPMGDTPDEGAVDREGRLFGHPDIRVVDGSIVPVNLGVNPSLTITALAEWVMAGVPRRGEGAPAGDPGVVPPGSP
ncbi:MAG TPA: GMC family oxidoreductase [Longimicrobiales bacterium]|nr:GMC family oxidoreductase [Longimicrobiales bacterium]